MFKPIRELFNYFIVFGSKLMGVRRTEEVVTVGIKSSLYLWSVLGGLIIILSMACYNQYQQIKVLKTGLKRVETIFDEHGKGPISEIVRFNEELLNQNIVLKQENILLISSNFNVNQRLVNTKLLLISSLKENDRLKKNNDDLLSVCARSHKKGVSH